MRAAFPEPVLTITPAAVRDLQGREALSGLWTLFTKCKESLQDGRRLENISWRLWYREIMRDGGSPLPSASSSPGVSRNGSSEQLCEEKTEKNVKETDSEKNADRSRIVSPLFASTLQQHPPISTPHSPPPAYVVGFDFISDNRAEKSSPDLASTDTVSRKTRAHPLTPTASQTSVDTYSEMDQGNQDTIIPSPAPSFIPRAPSIPQSSREFNPSSSALVEPSIPITSQSRSTDKRPTLATTSSTSSVLSASSAASASISSNSKPRRPSHRRRRSSFVDGTEEEPVNVGLIICEMLPSGLESSDKAPMHIPFPSPSLSQSSRAAPLASSASSSNPHNTPTLAVTISDVDQQLHGSSSSTPTTAATVIGAGSAFADLAKAAASTLPTPEIEVAEEDALPAPPRVGGARYPLVVPSPQTSPPRPHAHHQHHSQSGPAPPVIPPIIAPSGVQPPQLVIVTPTPGATPHPTPPATPLVGSGAGGRMYGQYLIVPKSSSQGRSKTRGGDGEREDGSDGVSTDEDEDASEDFTDSEEGDYEDDDEDEEEHVGANPAPISDVPVAATRSNASPPPHTGSMISATAGGNSQKRVSISSAISDRSTTSNASSNTTHTTSSVETRDTEASLQSSELKTDKGKQKKLASINDERYEQYGDVEQEYDERGCGDLDDEDAFMEEVEAEYERSLQRANPDVNAVEHELKPNVLGSDSPSSMATMKADTTKPYSASLSSHEQDQLSGPLEQQEPQEQPSKPLTSAHTKRRSPVITARSSKGLRSGFMASKGKSTSRSRSRNRDDAVNLTGALLMTASTAIASSAPQEADLGGPVSPSKLPNIVSFAPVTASRPVKASPLAPLPAVSAANTQSGAQVAVSPPPPSPTYSIQSTSSSGRGRSRNVVAIGRGLGSNGRGKRRGGQLVALRRRLSGDGRKGGVSPNDDSREGEEEAGVTEGGTVSVTDRKDENETSIEMDAHDMLDEEVNPQAKVVHSDSSAASPYQKPNADNQATAGPVDPVQVQAQIEAQIQAGKPSQAELVPTTELRPPVRFNIGSNSEDGTGSASASGSASVGRSGSTGFRSGSGSGSRTRGGVLKKRFEKAKARAVSRSVEEEKEPEEDYARQNGEIGGDTGTHELAAVQEPQPNLAQAQPATQPMVRPLLQSMGGRKGDRQLEELLKMEQRTHELASRQVSTVAVASGLPPVVAPLAPSPRPHARSPSQGRGKSPRTKSAIAQRANRSTGSTSKNLQDPQLMKVFNHVMDLPSNGNRQKRVVLATSESEEDDDDDYETETDVDEAGLVSALSPHRQQVLADMATTQAAPAIVQDQQQNDDDEWSSATDDIDDDVSPPSQARPRASPGRQRTQQQPTVRPPVVQRTYSSHYPAGRTGRGVKQQQQVVEQQRQQHLLQQQHQPQRNSKQRDTIEINRLPSESFQNLALAKLRNDSVSGLTRLLNPGLNEHELLSTVRRGYSSGDILRDSPNSMRRVPTGGTIGGQHGLRPLTSANPSLVRMPPMRPALAPMAAPSPQWNPVADPRVHMNDPHLDQNIPKERPPVARRHTENMPGPVANVTQPDETHIPAANAIPTAAAAVRMVSDVPQLTMVSPVAAPIIPQSRPVAALGPQPHRRQSSSSSTTTALRPNGLLTKLTLNKSFIAPASTTVTVNSLASDRASPAELNPKSGNSLYSKVPPDATSRIRALNALVNSRKPTPVAKSPPSASPIATSSSAPADAVLAAAVSHQSSLSPSPAPPVPATVHESITAPNGANVTVGLNGYGGAGRYKKQGPPADVELESEDEEEDGAYEDESSDLTDSVAEGTFQTERQKQIAASLACSLSADPILEDPAPLKPPVNSKGKGVPKATQAQTQRSTQGKGSTGARRGGKSVERARGARGSGVNVAAGAAAPEIAQRQVLPTGGASSTGETSQQRRLPKTLQFSQIPPTDNAPTRQASRKALQLEQNEQHPVRQQQQPPSAPRQPLHQPQDYVELQQQLERQLQQLEQQQIQQQIQQQMLQQQQLQYQQQQQYLQNAQQQQFMYQPPGHGQFGYPQQHQPHPQHQAHFYQQGGPSNHTNYTPIPYTQSQQHFPTASLQKLGYPYNLPVTAIPSSPRTTRRIMVKDEISESVRQGVVMGRKITRLNPGRRTSMGEDAEWRRPLTAAPSMVQLLPKGTLKAMGVEDDEPGASRRKGTVAEPDPAMRRALQHSRNKSWADTTHTSGW